MKSEMVKDVFEYTVTVNRTYWTCYNSSHRHTTKEIADRCIKNHERPRKQKSRRWTKDMYRDVLRLRSEGRSLADIGMIYGVQRERIRQVEATANRKKSKGWL